MGSEIRHNCGLCIAHTLHDIYSFIKSLQHRGREATGIAAIGNQRIDVIKWAGTVDRFDIEDLHKIFPSDSYDYHSYMAHVRYATSGRKDKILEDAHPHVMGGTVEHRGSHVIIEDCDMAAVHNGQVNLEYLTEVDKSSLQTECDTEALLQLVKIKGEEYILKNILGAYTIAIAYKERNEIVVMRDRTGIKPGVLGWKDGKHCIASEDIAIKENGGKFIEDLEPGHVYYLNANGNYSKKKLVNKVEKRCFFEWNYIASLESVVNGASVTSLRKALGEVLAEEFHPKDADYVTFLPRCPEAAAISYSDKTGIPFIPLFYKMRKERSFLGPTPEEREISIKGNLNLLRRAKRETITELLKNKTVILIDDSTIRGNNSLRARDLLYNEAKVKKAYLVNYTPQIGIIGHDGILRGCMFGVDMPPNDNFIARGRTIEEISEKIGMPTYYISIEGMFRAFEKVGIPKQTLCSYCIGGEHPFRNL